MKFNNLKNEQKRKNIIKVFKKSGYEVYYDKHYPDYYNIRLNDYDPDFCRDLDL